MRLLFISSLISLTTLAAELPSALLLDRYQESRVAVAEGKMNEAKLKAKEMALKSGELLSQTDPKQRLYPAVRGVHQAARQFSEAEANADLKKLFEEVSSATIKLVSQQLPLKKGWVVYQCKGEGPEWLQPA